MRLSSPVRRLIGYARVSTDEQHTDSQIDELRAAGCSIIRTEYASGATKARPVLSRLLLELDPGDVLVVVRLDRLARSVKHLLEVIETVENKGAHFRSLRDPIDTSTPQGMFSLQVLGAVAQLERSLIAERTRAGILAAKRRGRVPGNPGLRRRDPQALTKIKVGTNRFHLDRLIQSADTWLPLVRQLRPSTPWPIVANALNARGQKWTVDRLKRAVARLVAEKMADPNLLGRAPRRPSSEHLVALVAGIALADPDLSLRDIAAQLERMRERAPRGGSTWQASTVNSLLDRATQTGLVTPRPSREI